MVIGRQFSHKQSIKPYQEQTDAPESRHDDKINKILRSVKHPIPSIPSKGTSLQQSYGIEQFKYLNEVLMMQANEERQRLSLNINNDISRQSNVRTKQSGMSVIKEQTYTDRSEYLNNESPSHQQRRLSNKNTQLNFCPPAEVVQF